MAKQIKINYYEDLRLMAKRANQRMREMEKRGIESPAYLSVQSRLEQMGKKADSTIGRRFSETGKATWQEYQSIKSILNEYLNKQTTSTVIGYKKYLRKEYGTADVNTGGALSRSGITQEQWLEMWGALYDKEVDKLYGSSQIIRIVQSLSINGKLGNKENQYSFDDIAEIISTSSNLKDVQNSLGVKVSDYKTLKSIGAYYQKNVTE